MLILHSPAQLVHRYDLVEETRAVRSPNSSPASACANSWVELSEAAVIPLTEELAKSDAELLAFHRAEAATHCYHYVSFSCTFGPTASAPFERAWLEVSLDADGGGESPTAWSVAPKDAWEAFESATTASIGGSFRLMSGEIGNEKKVDGKTYFLRAYRERSADPYWEFRSTEATAIDGSYRFHLVTRTPAGSKGRGTLKLSATILKRKFLMLTKKETAEAPPEITFDLTA